MPSAPGHPGTPMIPVRGGNFGNNTETTLGALLEDAFGEGAVQAIAEIADKKGKEIAAKRAADAKVEAERVAKEKADAEKLEKDAKAKMGFEAARH